MTETELRAIQEEVWAWAEEVQRARNPRKPRPARPRRILRAACSPRPAAARPAVPPVRLVQPQRRPSPLVLLPAIAISPDARVHVLACRAACRLPLWCERDLTLRAQALAFVLPDADQPHSHVCMPLEMPADGLPARR